MINLETGGWNVTVNMSFKIYSTTLGGSRDIHFVMNMKILIKCLEEAPTSFEMLCDHSGL